MTFVLLQNYNQYVIVNDDADFIVGSVRPLNGRQGPYRVYAHVGPTDRRNVDAGVVNALEDAIPAFLAYYENYPLRWEWLGQSYLKFTLFVILRVEQNKNGHWLAYRDDYPLLRDGVAARFASCAEAQRAADVHELDLYPNGQVINDGLSWLPDPEIDWRSIPHRVEERARWQRSASSFALI
jgi:hypothetical protein